MTIRRTKRPLARQGYRRQIPLLSNWQETILRPIVVTVLTGGVLFALALVFKPLVHTLLAPPDVKQYPLACFAEPYAGNAPDERFVDFYIVNMTGKAYTRADLIGVLSLFNPDPNRTLRPDLELVMRKGEVGTVSDARGDDDFNRDKGGLIVETRTDGRTVIIRIDAIGARAFMKVTIRYSGMRNLGVEIRRTARAVLVPFDFDQLQNRCFQT